MAIFAAEVHIDEDMVNCVNLYRGANFQQTEKCLHTPHMSTEAV